ncbi:hypothetical protein MP228_009324 [Amoeboaphelidium protococcarum]|nr:hypothetical protein MP228_009324 [Amoeboaphelidium protococcarum]
MNTNGRLMAMYSQNADTKSLKTTIDVRTLTGHLVSSIIIDLGIIVGVGWIEDDLIVVLEDGSIRRYFQSASSTASASNGDGSSGWSYEMHSIIKDSSVSLLDVQFRFKRVVVMTSQFKFIMIDDCRTMSTTLLKVIPLFEPPFSWCILYSATKSILISTRESVMQSDMDSCQVICSPSHAVTKKMFSVNMQMVLSNNGKLLACCDTNGRVKVLSSDYTKQYLDFDTETIPQQLCWCGNDSILVQLDDGMVLMLGPSGDWIKFDYGNSMDSQSSSILPIYMLNELDGCRVMHSGGSIDFYSRVSDSQEQVFGIGSTSDGALLYDAFMNFEARDCASFNIIQSINDMAGAIDVLLDAAQVEHHVSVQKQLLRAVAFGRSFHSDASYASQEAQSLIKDLRVISQCKDEGLLLTFKQYRDLTLDGLLRTLLCLNKHYLAMKITQYCNAKVQFVANDWAKKKILQSKLNDEQLASLILQKLGKDVSFAQLAQVAYQIARPYLASLLLDKERNSRNQIPMLLQMRQYDSAFEKAIQSHDADFIYTAIFDIRRNVPLPQFLQMLPDQPLAQTLYVKYLKQQDINSLYDYYHGLDDKLMNAITFLYSAGQCTDVNERLDALQSSYKMLKNVKSKSWYQKSVDSECKLLTQQLKLEKEHGLHLVGKSLADTILVMLQNGKDKAAQSLKSSFKMPDRHFEAILKRSITQK